VTMTQTQNIYSVLAEDAPDDLVVNITKAPVIIGGVEQSTGDSPRIDPGDRRCGAYYLRLIADYPDAVRGLIQVKRVPQDRLDTIERERQIRTGVRAPKWVEDARKKAAADGEPPVSDKQRAAMVGIQKKQVYDKALHDNPTDNPFATGFADED